MKGQLLFTFFLAALMLAIVACAQAESARYGADLALLVQGADLTTVDNPQQKQNSFVFGIIFVVLLIVMVTIVLSRGMRIRKDINQVITEQNGELADLNHQISLKNEEITLQNESLNMQREMLIKNNEELAVKNEKLEELYREQNSLMSIVAHDLKSPLDQVKGLLQLMPLVGSLTDEQRDHLAKSMQVLDNGKQLIKNLLYVNKLEESSKSGNLETLKVDEVMDNCINNFVQMAEKKSIDISTAFEKRDFEIVSVRSALERIIDNLISNAIKFSPHHKKIVVSLTEDKGPYFKFSVKDEGPGIVIEDQERLFKKFQLLSNRPTGGESSSGLGLYIVKKLVDNLQGKIRVVSEPGKGTEFIIHLPVNTVDVSVASVKLRGQEKKNEYRTAEK